MVPRVVAADPEPGNSAVATVPEPRVLEPQPLASGLTWSVAGAAGVSATHFSIAPLFSETASAGSYLWSSAQDAVSAEVVESATLVVDHTTPQLAYLGLDVRHDRRPSAPLFGSAGHALAFERLGGGIGVAMNGNSVAVGAAVDATFGFLFRGSTGASLDVTAYVFDAGDLKRSTALLLSVGYVYARVAYHPYRAAEPKRDESRACQYRDAYHDAIAAARKVAEACETETPSACEAQRTKVRGLNKLLNDCILGRPVPPPPLEREAE